VDTPLDVTIRVNWKDGLRIEIEDNGVGIDPRAAAPDAPASTSRGHGLAIHSTLMAVVGGSLSVESAARKFTRVILVI
jgi:signal transduction histidine kinase